MPDTPDPAPQPQDPNIPPDMLQYRRVEGDYSAEDLKHLSDLEHVRQRPSM
jgi:hypothetical protein